MMGLDSPTMLKSLAVLAFPTVEILPWVQELRF